MQNEVLETAQFHRFLELPEHVQIEVMTNCLPKTRMNLSQSCKHLNRLLWSSSNLVKRIRLNIRLNHNKLKRQKLIEDLNVLLKNRENGRNYRKVKVYYYKSSLDPIVKAKVMEVMNFLGTSVTDLSLHMHAVQNNDLVELLRQFPILEKLMLDGFDEAVYSVDNRLANTQGLLQRLHTLNIDFPDSSILEITRDVNTLKSFTFQCYESDNGESVFKFGVKNLEDFIIKQNYLKNLKIYGIQRFPLFETNRIDEISFQLESLQAVCFFIHRNNAANFFKRQRNIKNLHLLNFFDTSVFDAVDRVSYSNILHIIFGLPKLGKVTIGHSRTVVPEDFELLSNIRNKSVKKLKYWEDDAKVIGHFLEIFPNLEQVQCEQKRMSFSAFPYDKLNIVSVSSLSMLSFTPSVIEGDAGKFEEAIINFLERHRDIKKLTIGQKDWIGTFHIVSLSCLKRVIEIAKNLNEIEIYNPQLLDESLKVLNNIMIHRLHI